MSLWQVSFRCWYYNLNLSSFTSCISLGNGYIPSLRKMELSFVIWIIVLGSGFIAFRLQKFSWRFLIDTSLHLCRSASSFLLPLIFSLHFRKKCTSSVFSLKLGSLQVLPWNLRLRSLVVLFWYSKSTVSYSLFAENGVIVHNLNYRPWQWVYSISGCKSFPGGF
jgi:hypothetical protein